MHKHQKNAILLFATTLILFFNAVLPTSAADIEAVSNGGHKDNRLEKSYL